MLSALASAGSFHSWLDAIPGVTGLRDSARDLLGPSWFRILGEGGNPIPTINHVLLMGFVFLVVVFLAARAKAAFKPSLDEKLTSRTFFEMLCDALMGLMEDNMGRKNAEKYLPLIGTLAVYIFFSNILALLPGFVPPTDNLNTTFAPAIIVFVATHVMGVKENGLAYFKHFLGPVVKWYALPLMLLMLVIETISHIVRPLSLSLRLMGNMYGDHAVLGVFLSLVPFIVPLPNLILGCIVVVVQTLVFCILSIVYISMAIEHHDEEH